MISNSEYDLCGPIASAMKAKAPYVGLPIPGHAPLVFDRMKLTRALKGVKPLDIRVECIEGSKVRLLCVEGIAGPRVRTRLRMAALDPAWHKSHAGREAMGKWRDAEQRAMMRRGQMQGVPKPAKAQKGLSQAVTVYRKLERELGKMGREHELRNPCLKVGTVYGGEQRVNQDERYLSLRRTRKMRTLVGALAKSFRQESTTKMYAEMRRRGWSYTPYSEVRQPMKEKYAANLWDYNRNLWRFVQGTGNQTDLQFRSCAQPDWMREARRRRIDPNGESDSCGWGADRYAVKIEDMRARQSLRAQIESIAVQFPTVPALARLEDLQRDLKTVQSGRWYRVGRKVEDIQAEIEALKATLAKSVDSPAVPTFQEFMQEHAA